MNSRYDLTTLKEYAEEIKLMDKFTAEEQEDIKAMVKELERLLTEEE